ncbi:MAG: ATP-dependent helicase HrpB [Zymomonas mobilis]|uniref:ATP-dependent helicase HrpB n=1 Tax=Zymomonas mobilis TaxID=542 RepID=A0A542W0D3_ZYMMB|nr:ATP-dependent helicase HrpB [Zymomonas mobilis]TQL17039.1 ATP-dependent helicase HrpB [Zymomonas mobilis]
MMKNNAFLTELPVSRIFEPLAETLRKRSNVVIIAPPGSGKTTGIAPVLLQEAWCQGQVILLSPRRLAAKAAAERIAQIIGEPVGQQVGYATRMESRRSDKTRILVVTQGIFRHQIQQDPELTGISAVLFDEVHERSLDGDFSLALALDVQSVLRPDLKLIAMSATMDGARFSNLMAEEEAGAAPVLESQGRSYPLHYYYEGRRSDLSIEQNMAAVIKRALQENEGGILAFLPGIAEIERTAALLSNLPSDISLFRLHSTVDHREQNGAIRPAPKGCRKVVLASAIAETSLTLDGIRIVVDSGLTRRARYDHQSGLTRLVTERVSRASAEQRAGRAGRQDVGYVWRLWEEAAQTGLSPYDPPEITQADLSALTLDCALWGVAHPKQLRWIDTPPEKAVEEAHNRLQNLQAISSDKRPLPHGHDLAALPMPLPLGHMILKAKEKGLGAFAVDVAVLLSERGVGGLDLDIESRLNRFYRDNSPRSQKARQLANRWRKLVGLNNAGISQNYMGEGDVGACVALAFPDRVAKRRDSKGEQWISVGGRGFWLDPLSPLAKNEWLAVAEAQGAAQSARIMSTAALEKDQINALFAEQIVVEQNVRFNFEIKGVETERVQRLGAIILSRGQDDSPDEETIASVLMDAIRQYGLDILPWSETALSLRERWAFVMAHQSDKNANFEYDLSDDALLEKAEEWLYPLLIGCRRLDRIKSGDLSQALENILGWHGKQQLDSWAPARLTTPAGSSHVIDYKDADVPAVEVRPQALFGIKKHPMLLNGQVPLVLRLVSPAGRPIQTTKNLPDFWTGSWSMVAKEMRGRYPRHPWPEDPAAAEPTLRTQKGRKVY